MLKKVKLFFLIFLYLLINISYSSSEIYIYAKVDDEIITNYDLEKESKYLKILNPNLIQLENNKILNLAKKSLIKEIIKKKEVKKIKNLDKENTFINNYLENLYKKLNYKNEDEFVNDLKKKNIYSLNQVKEKIKIELLWNELIFTKYKNQVKIDKKELAKKIKELDNKTQKEYLISEIVFSKKRDQSLDTLLNQIKLSIQDIGFNNTANIYSISESSKLGGKVGWINENSLSKNIIKKLTAINEGEYTDTIKIGNNYLILKIDQIKINKINIDKEQELEKLIKFETNKQLNQFSRIYFDKSKINYTINEK